MHSQEHLPMVVSAPAEIDVSNATQLRAALLAATGSCPAVVVVDMSRTVFCDSAGLSALVQGHKRAKADGGKVRLVITTASVLRILALTSADQLFPIFTSVPEALADGPAPLATAEQLETR